MKPSRPAFLFLPPEQSAEASVSAGVFQPSIGVTAMVLIDMKAVIMEKFKSTTGRFQRNRDGRWVGRMALNGEEIECWLVFDDHYPVKDEAFLKLSFTTPYAEPVC
jgi:hypothetical protein